MSYLGNADLDRPIAISSGLVYYAYGGGAFRLAPFRCTVPTVDGHAAFQLDLVRALQERDSRAVLSCTLTADYDSEAALQYVRTISASASLTSCVLTDWWFRVLPSAVLGAPVELTAPTMLASNGLGTARMMASMPLETGVVLESMLNMEAPLEGVAEAAFTGISPRVPIVVRFEAGALVADLQKRADALGALPRRAVVDYFSQDPATMPLDMDAAIDEAVRRRFADAITDRLIARCGRYVPAHSVADGPVVQFEAPAVSTSITWALSQPFLAIRRVVLPVNLLAAAQAQVKRLGSESVIRRTTSTSLPSLGHARVTALCNLPVSRTGVDALGVTLTFPPRPPSRPQARIVTALFNAPDDTATLDVRLSPGEPLGYRYSPFAVLSDEHGTRQIDAPERQGEGSPLHLSTEQFPIEFAVIEATAALGQLAIVSGVCVVEQDGVLREQRFTLDSGNLSTGIAIPRERESLTIDGYAIARDGSKQLRIGPLESPHVRLDVTSFPGYGPQQIEIRCVFDDSAGVQALSIVPSDREDLPENITAISFTPAEPVRSFRWSSRTPFAAGVRYRAFGVQHGGWTEAPAGSTVVVYSSQLHKQERQRLRRLESAPAGPAAPESAVDAVGISPSHAVTDDVLYDRISDPSKKLYIPRYALDVQSVSGQDRYRISMSQRNGTSTLEVNLTSAPAESLADQARDAEAYPHRVAVLLDFRVSASAGARKSLAFTEITRTANLVKASLTFATLIERDDVYRALTEEGRDARLVVQRHLDVRVPERPSSGGRGTSGFNLLPLIALPLRPVHTIRPVVPIPAPPPVVTPAVVTSAVLGAPVVTAVRPAGQALAGTLAAGGVALRSRIESAPARQREVKVNPRLIARPIPPDLVLRRVGRFITALPTPQLSCTGRQDERGQTRCTLSITNWAEFSDDLFVASSDLPPCGLNRSASRTTIDVADADTQTRLYSFCAVASTRQLSELSFVLPSGKLPGRVNVTLTDRRTKVERKSNAVETATPQAPVPPTRDLRMQLDQAISPAPFAFPPALHGYIFQDITPTTGSNQLIRYRLPWKGTFHTYLQDASRPYEAYVFPDEFKMARRSDPPFTPFATVRVSSREDASETDVVFDYVVAPYTDPKRLADARAQLLADPRFGAGSVTFQPFLTSDVRFFIDRPAMAGAVRQQRPDASVVLQGWLKDTLAMPLGDFRLMFDAMHRRTASLFIGRVEIDVPNHTTEVIPFAARMDDLAGEVFSYDITTNLQGELQVTARNEIESPLSVQTIDATITSAGQTVRGVVQGSALPTDTLAPSSTIQFTIRPERPLPSAPDPEVAFDLGGVTAIPNPEAIWDSILDRTTVEYFRIVTVKAIGTLFEPVAGREAERIVSILLEFEGGGTGELRADALEAKVRVDHPIDDVMLGRPVSSSYRYTVTVIHADGRQDRDASPREGSAATFFVNIIR